ncbi:hypothetical protein KGA66_16905 [Actinocrinis puniceicyclus]|uniref:Uncharacterized protein n=1 Tax=Actinocrinis puniceicyclus TaxID=977794 RepID=A0A8J7WSC0_9ACTN|nr:hypothetical protein [Actinocrinis puniceicyclus]MBS2964740.1 hypothetical protein [Actinocrinis puniceicyclus]
MRALDIESSVRLKDLPTAFGARARAEYGLARCRRLVVIIIAIVVAFGAFGAVRQGDAQEGALPMRTMLVVELDTEAGNKQIADHSMAKTMEEVLGTLKPEAAYFHALHGHRAMTLVVDAPDEASLATMAEPFWLQMNASVEAFPCMNADDLRTGLGRLG